LNITLHQADIDLESAFAMNASINLLSNDISTCSDIMVRKIYLRLRNNNGMPIGIPLSAGYCLFAHST
jgi:hypothetical protein